MLFVSTGSARTDGNLKRGIPMQFFDNLSGRVVAAVSSLAFSAFFLAAAIVPASPGVVGGGVFA